jgi:predicted RNase H-like HicB family nuclease
MNNVTYTYQVKKEGSNYEITCLDWPNVATFAEHKADIFRKAADATEGALQTCIERDLTIPMPAARKLAKDQVSLLFDLKTGKCIQQNFAVRVGEVITRNKK